MTVPDKKVDTDIFWALLKHVIPHDECRAFFKLVCISFTIPGLKLDQQSYSSDEFQLGKEAYLICIEIC